MPPLSPSHESQIRFGMRTNKGRAEIIDEIKAEASIHVSVTSSAARVLQDAKITDSSSDLNTVWIENPDYRRADLAFYYGLRYAESEDCIMLVTRLGESTIQQLDTKQADEEVVALIGAPVVFKQDYIEYDAYGVVEAHAYSGPFSQALEPSSSAFEAIRDTIAFMQHALTTSSESDEDLLAA